MRNHTKPRTIGNYFVDIIILKKKLNASFFDKKDMVERIRIKRENKELFEIQLF